MKPSEKPTLLPGLIYSIRHLLERQNHQPPLGISILNRRLCGVVLATGFARVSGETMNLYQILSDEREEQDDPLEDPVQKQYNVAGDLDHRAQLLPGQRIHAYVSRRKHPTSQEGVTAHLLKWYEIIYNPHQR